MVEIIAAQQGDELSHLIAIAHEYVTWMIEEIKQHYPELDIAEFASEHDYDDVRKKFPGDHIAPDGCLLIAMSDGQPAGCIALGRLEKHICEIRTLFVRPQFRGEGIGRKLVEAVLSKAIAFNYEKARLDTLGFMQGARKLYESYGFTEIEPYLDMTETLRQYIHFLESDL